MCGNKNIKKISELNNKRNKKKTTSYNTPTDDKFFYILNIRYTGMKLSFID